MASLSKKYRHITAILITCFCLFLSNIFFAKFDITENKRYTLSDYTKQLLKKIDKPIIIDILLKNNLPPEFNKLKSEVKLLLERFLEENSFISFNFLNPLDSDQSTQKLIVQLTQMGLFPTQVSTKHQGNLIQKIVFPWALVTYNDNTYKINLLKNRIGQSYKDRVNNSIQNLEYSFALSIKNHIAPSKKKIAILESHNTLSKLEIADILKNIRYFHKTDFFSLDSSSTRPQKTLDSLTSFNLLILPKPRLSFSDIEKQILDQFIMQGGKLIYLNEHIDIEMSDIFDKKETLALPTDNNLNDLFFKYGIRINQQIVIDKFSDFIVLASGSTKNTQFNTFPWLYTPVITTQENHLTKKGIRIIKHEFTNNIDTLRNTIKKTVLLESSYFSALKSVPTKISLNDINLKLNDSSLNKKNYITGILLEGEFQSVYKNRIKPYVFKNTKNISSPNKIIVIADGDIIKNQIKKNEPLELGYNKWTNQYFDNKLFLLNCINFLLDENDFIHLRNKKVKIAYLNKEKVKKEVFFWKSLNIFFPILFISIGIWLINYIRKRELKKFKNNFN